MDKNDPFTAQLPTPTSSRPLLGLTVLVVEDSRFTCEALRLLCLHSGARIRRADCLRSARRHLRVYRPSVAIVDLGLPDGDGLDLISEWNTALPRVEALIAISGETHLKDRAREMGADDFLEKPITSLAAFQEVILSHLPTERRPQGPRSLSADMVEPDKIAFQDDIAHIANVLGSEQATHRLDYVAQFVKGLARSAQDAALEEAAIALSSRRAQGRSARHEAARIASMLQARLNNRIAI